MWHKYCFGQWPIFLALFCLSGKIYSQDPEFTQFNSAPLHLNPAFAGITQGPRFNLNYRNQWPSLDKGYVTYATSFDMHIEKLNGGIGVIFVGDRIAGGLLSSYYLSAMYSYQLKLSRRFGIKMAVQGGYIRKHVDWNSLTFSDQINPLTGFEDAFGNINPTGELPPDNLSVNMPEIGAGFVAFSPKVYGGVSVKHLTKPKESFVNDADSYLPMRISLHAGGDINLVPKQKSKELKLSPNVLLAQQSNFTQLNIGTYVFSKYAYGGVWFRHTFSNSDAVMGVLGVKVSYVKIGYSYDYTISKLHGKSGGAHEVSIIIDLGDENPLTGGREGGGLECPSFLRF